MDAFETVSSPHPLTETGRRHFSLAEASRALPLVRRIVADIVREYEKLRRLRDTCRGYDAEGRTTEAEQVRQEYVTLTDRLSELKEELDQVGCELKDYRIGLVDFTALHDGQEVCLCWQLGEERIAFWHPRDAGFSGRRPITGEQEFA